MTSLSSIGPTANHQCPDCRRAQLFEQVVPNHGIDAVAPEEWACTVCGAALLVDPVWDNTVWDDQARDENATTTSVRTRVA